MKLMLVATAVLLAGLTASAAQAQIAVKLGVSPTDQVPIPISAAKVQRLPPVWRLKLPCGNEQ